MSKKSTFLKVAVLGLGLSFTALSNATVVTFDDLGHWKEITDGYHGLNWTNIYSIDASSSSGGYANANISGQNTTFNAGGNDVIISGNLFDFNGVYLTGAWNNNLNINVIGLKEGVQLYSHTVTVNTYAPQWFSFDFFGVDTVHFDSFGGTINPDFIGKGDGEHFAMDNFTFNEAKTSVPESSSLTLLALGLISLFGAHRLKK